ncbi:uncharacterized protein LOC110729346 isoform X2 [Chenopodium quinoa]|uniref:uncharacterized protein LOC110729346 isoform X2 n=1 Tax=Chenopodium quinoa TaxID=63459 RepID=UPI000B797668|nr:uncharacterized protein LOC110729346 isoform X2 [Chenopodium quinoa]
MLMDLIQENQHIQEVEDAIREVLTSTVQQPTTESSRPRSRDYVPRDREGAHKCLMEGYFSNTPLYNDEKFRQRFHMRKPVFMRIVNTLPEVDDYFKQKPDATGKLGASNLQKCTAAIRMLAYGTSAGHVDKYLKFGASTEKDVVFLACLGALIACIGNGKTVEQGGETCIKEDREAIVILEVVASWDTWIWHAFFGTPGSNNDINVLQRSSVSLMP